MKMMLTTNHSTTWFERAKKVIPGGVNSPVRAFGGVGGSPRFVRRGLGSRVWDEDGNEFIDFVCSWGALILGHAHPEVVKSLQDTAQDGLSFGAATQREVVFAELIQSTIPSVERLRLVNSGTEATMTAIRLARAFTRRSTILKFEGCYHGHADPFLVKAGSGLLTFGNPSSAGIPKEVLAHTLVASYNNLESLHRAFNDHGKDLACVIVEPVAGNMGVVLPHPQFLKTLAGLCKQHGALLIFDEVITGFRFHFGGVQSLWDARPDLTCLGKIIGGGLPLAAVGGREEILSMLAPLGPVYQAGTLSGNPVAAAAGLATLQVLQKEKPYARLEESAAFLAKGLEEGAKEFNLKVVVNRFGSMLSLFFNSKPVGTYEEVMASKVDQYKVFFHEMLKQGIYLPPSPFEAWFVSTAHTQKDLEQTIAAACQAFKRILPDLSSP